MGAAWLLALAVPARAQSETPPIQTAPPPEAPPPTVAAPAPVAVQSLAVLDLFSAGTGPGLGPDLWKNTSADLARTVLPLLAARPVSPAFAAFGRRVLTTSASGPDGGGSDPELAASRVAAVLALGDAVGADAILGQTNGLPVSAALSQVAAEAALILGHDDRACRIADALTTGRDGLYWLRLRGYCQALAGAAGAAQLTVDLADAQGKDPVYRRFMTVVLAGGGDPGPASLRNGLDYALSRKLSLDMTVALAKAPPSIAARFQAAPPIDGAPWRQVTALAGSGKLAEAKALRATLERNDAAGLTVLEMALIDAVLTVADGRPSASVLDQLLERAGQGDAKTRARAQAAAVLYAAAGAPMTASDRNDFARLEVGRAAMPPARLLALLRAAGVRSKGDAALLALWTGAESGAAGPGVADRAYVVGALAAAGLGQDAGALTIEGLSALQARSEKAP